MNKCLYVGGINLWCVVNDLRQNDRGSLWFIVCLLFLYDVLMLYFCLIFSVFGYMVYVNNCYGLTMVFWLKNGVFLAILRCCKNDKNRAKFKIKKPNIF